MAQEAERQSPRRADSDAPGTPARVGTGALTAKLAVCVLAFGFIGAGLLSTRQSRLQAGHEVTAARLRIREHDERLLTMRAEIAQRVSPAAVREMLERHGLDMLAPIAERTHVFGDPFADAAPVPGEDAGSLPSDIRALLDDLNRARETEQEAGNETGRGHAEYQNGGVDAR